MKKIIELDEFFPKTGELTVQPVLLWGSGRRIDTSRITKYASEALDYIKSVAPEPGKTALLLNAMGAEETYGPNRNGDGFPEFPVPARGKIASAGRRWFVPPGEELTEHYASFETNPAHAFKHHANRDPSKASGVVKKAFWNPRMHRVELLTLVDNDKDPEWIKRASDGEFVPVSMGCFLAGSMVTMSDGTRRPIETIQTGDVVRTHLGRGRKVIETHKRPYKGMLFAIRAEAHETVRTTDEHPFWTCDREHAQEPANGKVGGRWRKDARIVGTWTHAKCLDDQLLLEPVNREVATPDYVDRAFARLFGYYLAEGHVLRNREKEIFAIELSTHKDDAVHTEIMELCDVFGTRNAPNTHERANSENARGILICDPRLAKLCFEHGGGYAKRKKLSPEALCWHPDLQREMLGAYANGDGCGTEDGSLKLSTASTDLAWQWMTVLPRLGIIASVNQLEHKAGSGFSKQNTYEWVIHIGKQYAQTLRKVCAKVKPVEVQLAKNARRIVDDYVATPIREIDSMYVETDVFNIEVAEDESYLVAGLAVHNCRIKRDVCARCGNEAPTRADYCDHVKFAMNIVDENGFKDYVHNPSPDFFDISRVFRPADRTGYTLKKVADVAEIRLSADLGELSDRLAYKSSASQKLSDIDKVIRAEPVAASTLSPDEKSFLVKFRDHASDKLAASPYINTYPLLQWPLGEILGAAHACSVVLKDAEFIPLALSKLAGRAYTPHKDLVAKVAAAARWSLDAFAERPELLEELLDSGPLESSKIASSLIDFFTGISEKRGYVGEMLYRRLVPEGIGLRRDAAPTTDVLHTPYGETTRGAAIDAQDAVTRAHMGKVLGGGALLLGGYKALTAFPALRKFKAPLAVGAGLLGAATLGKRPGGTIQTDEGYRIPDITEMSSKTASQESIVHLIECAQTRTSHVDFSSIKIGSMTDTDALAEALGILVLT